MGAAATAMLAGRNLRLAASSLVLGATVVIARVAGGLTVLEARGDIWLTLITLDLKTTVCKGL